MAALISAYTIEGKRIGACDANCYGAKVIRMDACTCVCGGANHGVGLHKAFENTQALNGLWKKTWRKAHKGEKITFEVEDQMPLFLE
jgi:hypothetical protein